MIHASNNDLGPICRAARAGGAAEPARLTTMALTLTINGQSRIFADLGSPVQLAEVVGEMGLKADRVAVELNGEIAPRATWHQVPVSSGDRLEVVHFVGGGSRNDLGGWRRVAG